MIELNGQDLTLKQFVQVARENEPVCIAETAKKRVLKSRRVIDDIVKNKQCVYGVNTGFGRLSDDRIACDDLDALQVNLLKSHACGVGEVFSLEVVKGMMLLRINALIKGYSGIRLVTIEKLMMYLNKGIIPVVYEQGSLGASGDLVPLAHMGLPLIGLGEVFYQGVRLKSGVALKQAGVEPLDGLKAKEGLALINGTQAMTSVAALAVYDAEHVLQVASLSSGLTFEALRGIVDVFEPMVHAVRNHTGQIDIARSMRSLLKGSKNVSFQGELRVQDAYSLRCIPQVHGASLESLAFIKDKVIKEMNAVTDNPIVFEDGHTVSAGNFHGQMMALSMDYLAIAMSEIANISERRIERMVNPCLNDGLPPFLVKKSGLHSGFMIVQYAAASLVSENKVLSHPASVDSISSSGNQEDHVSMGTISARKALKIVKHTRQVIAMELLTASQALDFRGHDKLSPILDTVYKQVREVVPFVSEDTQLQPFIVSCEQLIIKEKLVKGVEDVKTAI